MELVLWLIWISIVFGSYWICKGNDKIVNELQEVRGALNKLPKDKNWQDYGLRKFMSRAIPVA